MLSAILPTERYLPAALFGGIITIDIMDKEPLNRLLDYQRLPAVTEPFDKAFYCQSRDEFQARLDNLFALSQDPVLTAVCGELGNNSFDHNLGAWADIPGMHFIGADAGNGKIIIADRGQGIRKSLSRVVPGLKDDLSAVRTAFERVISGRSPEHRGNGLKFVLRAVKDKGWYMYFQSGDGAVEAVNGTERYLKARSAVAGCVAVIEKSQAKEGQE